MRNIRSRVLFSSMAIAAFAALSGPAAAQQLCPAIVDPVCGLTPSDGLKTFNNSCLAEQASAVVLHKGTCPGPICPMDVVNGGMCARSFKTNKVQWFANQCGADNGWAVFANNGKCKM